MRIVLIRQRYRPDGGAERFVARAAEALGEQGVELTLISRHWPKTDAHLRHVRCDPWYWGGLWRDLSFAACACRMIRTLSADLVQAHERIPCCDVFRAGDGLHREWLYQRRRALGYLGRLRLLFNPHHYYTLWAEARTLRSPRLKAVICGSQMVRDEILAHFPIAPEKLHVLYNGIDCEHFHPRLQAAHRVAVRALLAIPEDLPLFVFVGSGFQRKGLDATLRALATLPADAGLLVVGQDKRQAAYVHLSSELGVGKRVWFVGRQEDPRPFYGAGDAFVLPALYDPSPNVILEAMACGLPVIASPKCGTAELICEGQTGFVRDALDMRGLATAMTVLLNKETSTAMGTAARTTILPYDLAQMGERFVRFYKDLLHTPV